jgi:hypothetical protein
MEQVGDKFFPRPSVSLQNNRKIGPSDLLHLLIKMLDESTRAHESMNAFLFSCRLLSQSLSSIHGSFSPWALTSTKRLEHAPQQKDCAITILL